jgi:hypothetical protein
MFLVGLLIGIGCGKTDPVAAPEVSPLTVEQWKELPVQLKYEVDTFERLKAGNPKLQEPKEWEKFNRQVLLPAKKKDIPSGAR